MSEKYIERKMKGMPGAPEVMISNDDGTFYTLSNGSKVNKKIFENYYEKLEIMDVNNFFKPSLSSSKLVQDLMQIDTARVPNDNMAGTSIKVLENFDHTKNQAPLPDLGTSTTPKFVGNQQIPDRMSSNDVSQFRVLEDDEEESAVDNFIQGTNQPHVQQKTIQPISESVSTGSYTNNSVAPIIHNQPQQTIIQHNPEELLFKMFKNNFDIKIKLEFDRKMASPDFIKMMSENFETDIIRYYTKKFLNSIINDSTTLEDVIYKQLQNIIFEGKKEKKKKIVEPLIEGNTKSNVKPGKKTTSPSTPPTKKYKSKISELKTAKVTPKKTTK